MCKLGKNNGRRHEAGQTELYTQLRLRAATLWNADAGKNATIAMRLGVVGSSCYRLLTHAFRRYHNCRALFKCTCPFLISPCGSASVNLANMPEHPRRLPHTQECLVFVLQEPTHAVLPEKTVFISVQVLGTGRRKYPRSPGPAL